MAESGKEEKKEAVTKDQTQEQLKTMTEVMMDLISENRTQRKELEKYRKTEDESKEAFDCNKLISLLLTKDAVSRDTKIKMEEKELSILCKRATQLFLSENALLKLSFDDNKEYIIIGPLNGHFPELLNVLKNGLPNENKNINYLFLGNYINRGVQGLETISLLLSLKLKYPNNIYLLRGNHECEAITRIYGFHKELKELNLEKLYTVFLDCFECMPIAATIDDKIFCVCGGISPLLDSLETISNIQRPLTIPVKGLLTDLLWSDPVEDDNDDYVKSLRGAGCHFGPKQVSQFCQKFKFELIVRGLKYTKEGYEQTKCGRVITVFSIPDYCGLDNEGTVVKINKDCKAEFIKSPRNNVM